MVEMKVVCWVACSVASKAGLKVALKAEPRAACWVASTVVHLVALTAVYLAA